jgi:hypothetical protein
MSIGVIDFCEVIKLGELSVTQFCLFMEIMRIGVIDLCEVTNLGELGLMLFCLLIEINMHLSM